MGEVSRCNHGIRVTDAGIMLHFPLRDVMTTDFVDALALARKILLSAEMRFWPRELRIHGFLDHDVLLLLFGCPKRN
jgi:hypothetical protein